MNRDYAQVSSTMNTVVMAGLLASTLLPLSSSNEINSSVPSFSLRNSSSNNYAFLVFGHPPTNDAGNNLLAVIPPSPLDVTFGAVVSRFFEGLSSSQEALGLEFEQILFENIWDLYQV